MSISTKKNHNSLLMFTLTLGVFGILNTEMGVVGIIPIIADTFGVTVPDAGWTVSLFALIIAFSAPVVPLLFSRVNRKTVMVLALSVFVISNLVSVFTTNFTVLLITRCRSGILSSVVRIHRFFNCRLVRQSGGSSESRFQNLRRSIGGNGARSTYNKLYRQRIFVFGGNGIFYRCQCGGTPCNPFPDTVHAR